jgi:hypothetical protein
MIATHPKAPNETDKEHHDFTSVVLYMAVTEKEGNVKDGGMSYSGGRWAPFIAKIMR